MRNVLVISATPRKDGNSEILAEQAAAGAREKGAQVEVVHLRDYEIGYCRACMGCMRSGKPECVRKDGMAGMYEKLRAADGIVFATPVYFFTVSGQMKVFLDRTFALGAEGNWKALAGKQVGYLMTYGDPDPLHSGVVNAYAMFRDASAFLGMKEAGCVHAACGDVGQVRKNEPALAAAKELGRRMGAGAAQP